MFTVTSRREEDGGVTGKVMLLSGQTSRDNGFTDTRTGTADTGKYWTPDGRKGVWVRVRRCGEVTVRGWFD